MIEKDYKKLCTILKRSLKTKVVTRQTLHFEAGHKLKNVEVKYLEDGWYSFEIDGYKFDCKWFNNYGLNRENDFKNIEYKFRNNDELKRVYGDGFIKGDYIRNATSLYFGGGTNLIKILWVFGDVIPLKPCNKFF